jgi:hypothetical protein
VRVLIQVVDTLRVEERRAALDAMHLITHIEQELGQISAILAGYSGDQSFPHVCNPLAARASQSTADFSSAGCFGLKASPQTLLAILSWMPRSAGNARPGFQATPASS